jgi:hypothetical protein
MHMRAPARSIASENLENRAAVESFSFVANGDCDFSVHVATARDVNSLAGVLTITVDHGIRQGFMQSHLDVTFAPIHASKVQNEAYELISEWRDGRNFTWERLSQLDEGSRMSISRQKRERLSVNHSRTLHLKFPCHCSWRKQGSCQI